MSLSLFRATQVALLIIVTLSMIPLSASQAQGRLEGRVPNRFIVSFEPGVVNTHAVAAEIAAVQGVQVRNTFNYALKGAVIEIPGSSQAGILTALRKNPQVRAIAADRYVSVAAETNPKGVRRVSAEFGIGVRANDASSIDVVVMDTGIDFAHLDLPNVDTDHSVQCLAANPCEPGGQDVEGHGTNVASAVAAAADSSGIVGVAPAVNLISVRVFDASGNGTFGDVIAGIDYIISLNNDPNYLVEVVNMSFREVCNNACDLGDYPPVHNAVKNLVASGTTVIAAAGNDSTDVSNVVPARFEEVITVSAMADSDGLPGADGRQIRITFQRYTDDSFASFSNYGSGVDVIAPGVKELLARLGGGTEENTGTSFSAPYAAGVAAIFIRDRLNRGEPTPSPYTVRQALIETGECYGSDATAGYVLHGISGCPQTWPGDPDGVAEPLVRADNVANFGPSLPVHDLAVTGLDPDAPILAGEPHSVLVTIRNEGTEDETDFSVSLSDNVDTTSTSAPQAIISLTAGATTTLTFSWTPTSLDDHGLTAVVDTVSGESDAADNSLSMTVTVQNPVHDVAVTAIAAPATVTQGDTVNVTVDISNSGTFDEDIDVGLSATAGTVGSNQLVTLNPGGTDSLTFTWDTTAISTLGDETLTATATVGGETNLVDNSRSTTSTIVAQAPISLTATGYKVRGLQKVDLNWSGANSTVVDIWRDGSNIETTANNSSYTDNINSRGGGSYTYWVCEDGSTTTCSNSVAVTF